jgi:hypothetical protein
VVATPRGALGVAWSRHRGRVGAAALASLTLGLAPFVPHAHVWKQLVSLAHGTLTAPMDIFDLALHGAPWVALFVTLGQMLATAASIAAANERTS